MSSRKTHMVLVAMLNCPIPADCVVTLSDLKSPSEALLFYQVALLQAILPHSPVAATIHLEESRRLGQRQVELLREVIRLCAQPVEKELFFGYRASSREPVLK